jgi:serine protease
VPFGGPRRFQYADVIHLFQGIFMAFFRTTGSTRFQGCLLLALAACLPAAVAAPKLPAGLKAVPAIAGVTEAPVSRLMIRYRSSVKLAGQGGATPATERLEAAAVVARTASLAGQGNLHYLKSVSASLHVATLDQAVSPVDAAALMQRLRADPAVLAVEIDRRVKAHFVPNDPLYSNGDQWHLRSSSEVVGALNAFTAWDSSNGGGVVVAVLDGGYRPHADLAPNLLSGYDFVSADDPASFGGNSFWTANDSNARDGDASDPGDWVPVSDAAYCDSGAQPQSSWHGTHVTGIVAALGNNNLGGLGVAFGARVLPVRVLGRCGGYTSDILAGARWAAGLAVQGVPVNVTPAKVLNLSLGVEGVACDPITQSEIDAVRARNVSIVASSGNGGDLQISSPANCKGVVAVTAHTREGDSADYANVGSGVALSAPGGGTNTVFFTPTSGIRGVVSTWNTGATVPGGDAFVEASGTSMAAPQVAGVLALVASLRPDLPMAALEEIVINAVRPFPAGGYCATNPNGLPAGFCGSGLLDAQKAVLAAAAYVTPAPSSGGGGCTVAPNGQADAGLVLLGMAALLMLIWRRRSSR